MRNESEIRERLDRVKDRIDVMCNEDGYITVDSGDASRDTVVVGLLGTQFELEWVLGNDPFLFNEDLVNDDGTIKRMTLVECPDCRSIKAECPNCGMWNCPEHCACEVEDENAKRKRDS